MKDFKNAIVVMLDSWQFNYNGCYGNDWIKTPNIDRFAREGVLFENAYGEGMPTIPVRRALHTGRHTLHETGWSPLRMVDTTIADNCWGTGIDTAIIFDCPMYRLPKFGYTRSFDKVYFLHGHEGDHDHYEHDELIHLDPKDFLSKMQLETMNEKSGADVLSPLLKEISCYLKNRQYWKVEEDQDVAKVMKMAVQYLHHADKNHPFFLWIDSFDPHEPWDPPSVYDKEMKCPYDPDYVGPEMFVPVMGDVDLFFTERELHHIRMLYAEKVTMCDTWFGYLTDAVRALGLWDNTMMVLISDHGEPLGHGEHGHGIMRKCRPWPYEELVHIPLIIKAPGLPAGTRIKGLVQNFDIAATVSNWLGLPTAGMHSIDLWPLMTGQVQKIRDFVISGYYGSAWAMYTEDYSFIHWVVGKKDADSVLGLSRMTFDGVEGNETFLQKSTIASSEDTMDLDAMAQYIHATSLDGAQQWTCTPGSKLDVPEDDQLFDRKKDPFQLKNIIKEKPEVAEELLRKLSTYMGDLKAS